MVAPAATPLETFGNEASVVRQCLVQKNDSLMHAMSQAVLACVSTAELPSSVKPAKLAVRDELQQLLWPGAHVDSPGELDSRIVHQVQQWGLPPSKEEELLSQLSNGQKKMCETKLKSFIKGQVFATVVRQLHKYQERVVEDPGNFKEESEEVINKLGDAALMLMCESKLKTIIKGQRFANVVEQLHRYQQAVSEDPGKFSKEYEEVIDKLRDAASLLKPTSQQVPASSTGSETDTNDWNSVTEFTASPSTSSRNSEPQVVSNKLMATSPEPAKPTLVPSTPSPSVTDTEMTSQHAILDSLPDLVVTSCDQATAVETQPVGKVFQAPPAFYVVKNTFIEEVEPPRQSVPASQSCLAGCNVGGERAQKTEATPWQFPSDQCCHGRSASVVEVASHWDDHKWHETGNSKGNYEVKTRMSPSFMAIVIEALEDESQDPGELAGHISANAQALDSKMQERAAELLEARIARTSNEDSREELFKALAACTKLDFLNRRSAQDLATEPCSKVAQIFEEHLRAMPPDAFPVEQLPQLMHFVMRQWPHENEATERIISSCVEKMLDIHQANGVVLGVKISDGKEHRLLPAAVTQLVQGFSYGQLRSTPQSTHARRLIRLYARMYPLRAVIEIIDSCETGRSEMWKAVLEEITKGFEPLLNTLLSTYENPLESEKQQARQIITNALQHPCTSTFGVHVNTWISKSTAVHPLQRFEMQKRFYVFTLVLGEMDLWNLIEGNFRNADGPQDDFLAAAMRTAQDVVQCRSERGQCSPTLAEATSRIEIILKIKTDCLMKQMSNGFVSSLACCLGAAVGDVTKMSGELPARVCDRLLDLSAETKDSGVLHGCVWALGELLDRCTLADETQRQAVKKRCLATQEEFYGAWEAYVIASKIVEKCTP